MSARQPSKHFPSRPNESVIQSFLTHIRESGSPQTWWAHSHSRPPRDAKPVLLKRFDLPEAFSKVPEKRAVCPICRPETPMYNWGYLSWYPKESAGDDLVRAIGHDCGAQFFGAVRYQQALDVLRREQDEEADRAYVSRELPRIAALSDALRAFEPWTKAAQSLRVQTRKALPREFILTLIRAQSLGDDLYAQRPVQVPYRQPNGEEGMRTEHRRVPVARVKGASFLADSLADLDEEHHKALRNLEEAQKRYGADATAADAAVAAKLIKSAKDIADKLDKHVSTAVEFASVANLEQLQLWSRAEGSEATAQVISLDGKPKFSVYRFRKVGIPSMGMKPPVQIDIEELLRTSAPSLTGVADPDQGS